jgi:hypothetical protein
VRGCPEADTITCRDCGLSRVPYDIRSPGACPDCYSQRHSRERCIRCDYVKFENAMAGTAAGLLLAHVLVYDQALQLRMHVSLDDLSPEEFKALFLLHVERNKKQEEDMRKATTEARRPMTSANTLRR